MSSNTVSSRFLRNVLLADAGATLASAILHLAGGAALAAAFGVSAALLLGSGLFMLGYAALAGWLAARPAVPRPVVALIALGNLGWAAGCLALLGLAAPTTQGAAWLVFQAFAVTVLGLLQWSALRRPAATPAWT